MGAQSSTPDSPRPFPGPRARNAPGSRRIPVWAYFVVGAVVAVIVVAVVLSVGTVAPKITIDRVLVTDTAGHLSGATPTNQSFSGSAGDTIIIKVPVHNNNSKDDMCITGATAAPSEFSVVGMSPPGVCLTAQTTSPLYVSLGLPSHSFRGTVTVLFADYDGGPPQS